MFEIIFFIRLYFFFKPKRLETQNICRFSEFVLYVPHKKLTLLPKASFGIILPFKTYQNYNHQFKTIKNWNFTFEIEIMEDQSSMTNRESVALGRNGDCTWLSILHFAVHNQWCNLQTPTRQRVTNLLLWCKRIQDQLILRGSRVLLAFLATWLNVDSWTNLEQVSVFGSEFLDLEVVFDVGLAADDAAVEEQRLLKPSTSTFRQIN